MHVLWLLQEIKEHPLFQGLDWENLHKVKPPVDLFKTKKNSSFRMSMPALRAPLGSESPQPRKERRLSFTEGTSPQNDRSKLLELQKNSIWLVFSKLLNLLGYHSCCQMNWSFTQVWCGKRRVFSAERGNWFWRTSHGSCIWIQKRWSKKGKSPGPRPCQYSWRTPRTFKWLR